MNIEIVLKEQTNLCGDEYLDEKDFIVKISDSTDKDYIYMETESRVFLVEKEDIRKLAKIF